MIDINEKRRSAPALAIAGIDGGVLDRQQFRDWKLIAPTPADGFLLFAQTPGRYMMLVLDPDGFARCLHDNSNLLLSLVVDTELRGLSVNLITVGDANDGIGRYVVAVLVSSMLVLDHPGVARTDSGFAVDLVRQLRGVTGRGEVGETHIGASGGRGQPVQQILAAPSPATVPVERYAVPAEWRDANELARLRLAIRARPESDRHPVTFRVNDFYGHARVLQDYCGTGGLPIHGQVQHGWTLPGYYAVVGLDHAVDVALLWSQQAIRPEYRHFEVIGAPYLYLPDAADPGPLWPRGLLAIPSHGIAQHPMRDAWDEYAAWVASIARERELSPVSVCLHPADATDATVRAFESYGIAPLSCGSTLDVAFLHRFRSFVRQHAVVTTNRISTAAFYAMHEKRQLVMGGPIMGTDPPDRGEELSGDLVWTRDNYPELFLESVEAGYALAERELGSFRRRTPLALRRLLFGWYYGAA